MGEIFFHIFILCGLGTFYVESLNINTNRATDIVGAAGFVQFIIILGFILTLISLFFAVKKRGSIKDSNGDNQKKQIPEFSLQFLGIILSVIIFIFLSYYIGYLLSGIILMAGTMILLGQRKPIKISIISILTSFAFVLVFGKILHVPLPRGISFFKELSYFLY